MGMNFWLKKYEKVETILNSLFNKLPGGGWRDYVK